MRKIAVFGGFLAFMLVLAGCEEKSSYSVSITNGSISNKSVVFIYNDTLETLAVSETKTYEVDAYTEPPKYISDQKGIASIIMNQNGVTGDYTFSDADSFDLHVINNSPFAITIKADNFIDNGESIGDLSVLTIDPDDINTVAKIYTKNPKFTSTFSYPITIEYIVVEKLMLVTIRQN